MQAVKMVRREESFVVVERDGNARVIEFREELISTGPG